MSKREPRPIVGMPWSEVIRKQEENAKKPKPKIGKLHLVSPESCPTIRKIEKQWLIEQYNLQEVEKTTDEEVADTPDVPECKEKEKQYLAVDKPIELQKLKLTDHEHIVLKYQFIMSKCAKLLEEENK